MAKPKPKQSTPILKSKFGRELGYRTPDFFKGRTFNPSKSGGIPASSFRITQHKGGS